MPAAKALIWTCGLLCACALASPASAQQPSYLIVRPTSRVEPGCETTKWKPSKNLYVSRTPYAYGYFGASASDKWSRSTNYHRSYTQWQRR
jgi:hypothetical protein